MKTKEKANMKKTIIYLCLLLFTLVISSGVMAQDGTHPFVNSTHHYSVTAGNSGNAFAWKITGGTSSDYTLTPGSPATSADILWKAAGTYTLEFRETSTTGSCITLVTKTIEVGANTFNVSTSSPSAMCNAATNVPNVTPDYVTHVQFSVAMTTGTTFSPNWQFTFSLTPTAGVISNVKVDGAAQSGSGPYTVTGLTSTNGSKTVIVECDITGNVNTFQQVAMSISNVKENTYNTPENNIADNAATQAINAIPSTSSISAN
jgi:hypothetical protein